MSKPLKLYNRLDLAQLSNIPKVLTEFDQWVVWRIEKRGEDDTGKPLFDAKTGRAASHSDPKTWSSYEKAVKKFAADASFNGIGFVFSVYDPFTGIDLDECRDPETGKVDDWAQEVIHSIDSYTEVSPSGLGFKIFTIASPPNAGRRDKVEVYPHTRYFTVTGNHVPETPLKIENRQGEVADLCARIFPKKGEKEEPKKQDDATLVQVRAIPDDELLAKARASTTKFSELFDKGDKSSYSGNDSSADYGLVSYLAYWTRGDRERIDRLFRRSKIMRPKWDSKRGSTTYGWQTIDKMLTEKKDYYNPWEDVFSDYNGTDLANARLFESIAAGNYVHCRQWGKWLAWEGHSWQFDAEVEVYKIIERVPYEVRKHGVALLEEDRRKHFMKWSCWAESVGKLNAMESIGQRHLSVPDTLFDARPMLLACANGVVDLKTGKLRPGERNDYLTRGLSISYLPEAKCPRWDKFLNEIMLGDQDMVAYLWRVLGYALTGSTEERAFFFLHGTGRNGKTLFTRIVSAVLGRYAQAARFSTFLQKRTGGGVNDDVAHLMGARVVIASEAERSSKLDASLIKNITGQDKVRARFLYSGEFEFEPQFKLFLVTNHVPKIDDESHALWDRLHYVPFRYRVVKEDTGLYLTLLGELEGILAKMVRGATAWHRERLKPPEKVQRAGRELRENMDIMAQAWEEIAELDSREEAPLGEVYAAFSEWAKREHIGFFYSRRSVAQWLRDRDIVVDRSPKHANAVYVTGVRLLGPGRMSQDQIDLIADENKL